MSTAGPTARCKFTVRTVTVERAHINYTDALDEEKISMQAEYDPRDTEDNKFSRATPSGSLDFRLSNPNLLGKFRPGQKFYLTLIPIEESA